MKKKETVLIIAPRDDLHAVSLSAILDSEFGVGSIIWNRSSLPAESKLDFRLDADVSRLKVDGPDGSHTLNDFRSIWWRRPFQFHIDEAVTDPQIRGFCESEYKAFFKGALRTIDTPIINNPFQESVAAKKPFQLATARQVGLAIPRTLMSNNPASIRAFWQSLNGNCIYKSFTSPRWRATTTRMLTEADLPHLDTLRHAPMIVQEKIEKGVDVRVNIFGESVFAAAVKTQTPDANLDWRLDATARWYNHALPREIGDKLIALLKALGLQYGCIDLRQQPDGNYKFLEVNPSGQFLFAEIDTGQPLLHALAHLLVSPNGRPAKRESRRSTMPSEMIH